MTHTLILIEVKDFISLIHIFFFILCEYLHMLKVIRK